MSPNRSRMSTSSTLENMALTQKQINKKPSCPSFFIAIRFSLPRILSINMSTVQSTTSLPHDWRKPILQEIRHVLETNQCCWAITKAARCGALMRRATVDEAQSISTALENQPFDLSALHPIFSSITPLVLCKRWHKTHADSLHHLAGIKPQML